MLLHNTDITQICFDFFQLLPPDVRVCNFTPTKLHLHFDFFTLFEPTTRTFECNFNVVVIRFRAQLNGFDFDFLLILFGAAHFTLLLILKLAEIHDLTNWWICLWCNLDQINTMTLCGIKCFSYCNNTYIACHRTTICVLFFYNEANFFCPDLVINPKF